MGGICRVCVLYLCSGEVEMNRDEHVLQRMQNNQNRCEIFCGGSKFGGQCTLTHSLTLLTDRTKYRQK